ncbi:unnamed protein product [Coregonus sp. 'balchen']|nr:unnamed protein product [Coregonus sp. 'balchen']
MVSGPGSTSSPASVNSTGSHRIEYKIFLRTYKVLHHLDSQTFFSPTNPHADYVLPQQATLSSPIAG